MMLRFKSSLILTVGIVSLLKGGDNRGTATGAAVVATTIQDDEYEGTTRRILSRNRKYSKNTARPTTSPVVVPPPPLPTAEPTPTTVGVPPPPLPTADPTIKSDYPTSSDEFQRFTEKLERFFTTYNLELAQTNEHALYGIQTESCERDENGLQAETTEIEAAAQENYVPLAFTHIPDKTYSGVEDHIFQLAATLSAAMYQFGESDESLSSTAFNYTGYPSNGPQPTTILAENWGMFQPTTPPFSVTVVGNTMILAWRGSLTLVDWITDASFSVTCVSRWSRICQNVKTHAGFTGQVDYTLLTYEDFILDAIETYSINEIITTGHSYGGGIAQVAAVWIQASMSSDEINGGQTNPRWQQLQSSLTVRVIGFEAPSAIIFNETPDDPAKTTLARNFLQLCGSTMIVTCFQNDIVPRLPANPNFLLDELFLVMEQFLLPSFFRNRYITNAIIQYLEGLAHQKVDDLIRELYEISIRYQFIGLVAWYPDQDSVPTICVDDRPDTGGLVYQSNDSGATTFTQFNSIGPVDTDVNPTTSAMDFVYAHDFPITGQGFSFSFLPYYCTFFGYGYDQLDCTNLN